MKYVKPSDDMPIHPAIRRPVFGAHGRRIIAALCVWEIVALVPHSPVPTISRTVRQFPPFGWVLLGLLGHHWFVELEHALEQAVLDMDDESAT